jgi:hypothetical protein
MPQVLCLIGSSSPAGANVITSEYIFLTIDSFDVRYCRFLKINKSQNTFLIKMGENRKR